MLIPDEVLERYDVSKNQGEEDIYRTFLKETDRVPNKIIESLITSLSSATALNFVSVFVNWLRTEYNNNAEIIRYRNIARQEINRIEEENTTYEEE